MSRVRIDDREIRRFQKTLKAWATDQIPFATAFALTKTAQDARDHVREKLGASFRIRNKGLRNGISFLPARKRAKPIEAFVHLRPWAEFLRYHALGGVKRARGSSRLAVPTSRVRRTTSGRIRKAYLPRVLRDRRDLAKLTLRREGQILLTSKRRAGLYFTLKRSVRIKPRWPYFKQIEQTVARRLAVHFDRALTRALRTAR